MLYKQSHRDSVFSLFWRYQTEKLYKPFTKSQRPDNLLQTSSFLKCSEQRSLIRRIHPFHAGILWGCTTYFLAVHLSETGRNGGLFDGLLHHNSCSHSQKQHNVFLFSSKKKGEYPAKWKCRSFWKTLDENERESPYSTIITIKLTTRRDLFLAVLK